VLERESAAPAWQELVPLLRRKELRGELRGGRFIHGVSGEQYATEDAIQRLRAVREQPDDAWIVISAADPTNVSGIVVPGPRVPALPRNALALRDGVCIAARRGREIEFFAELDEAQQAELRLALTRGRKKMVKSKRVAGGPDTSHQTRDDAARDVLAAPAERSSAEASSGDREPTASPTLPLEPPADGRGIAGYPRARGERRRDIRRRWTQF
jgi:hypothetical protein